MPEIQNEETNLPFSGMLKFESLRVSQTTLMNEMLMICPFSFFKKMYLNILQHNRGYWIGKKLDLMMDLNNRVPGTVL